MEEVLQLALGRGSWLKMFILKQGPKTVCVCVRDKNPAPHFYSLAKFLTPKCISKNRASIGLLSVLSYKQQHFTEA